MLLRKMETLYKIHNDRRIAILKWLSTVEHPTMILGDRYKSQLSRFLQTYHASTRLLDLLLPYAMGDKPLQDSTTNPFIVEHTLSNVKHTHDTLTHAMRTILMDWVTHVKEDDVGLPMDWDYISAYYCILQDDKCICLDRATRQAWKQAVQNW